MAVKRLPTLPFLPQPPSTIGPKYASDLNIAINSLYRNLAQSVDGMLITATNSTQFPAAQGFKRFAFDGSTLYIDHSTTSWTPINSNQAVAMNQLLLPIGANQNVTAAAGPGANFPVFMPVQIQNSLAYSSLDLLFSVQQATAVGSSQARSLSISAAWYTPAEPMLKLSSSSTLIAWTVTGATFSGSSVKRAVLPWTINMSAGNYVLGLLTSTSSSGNGLANAWSQIVNPAAMALSFGGDLTASTSSASNQMLRFYAVGTASTNAFANSMSASTLNGNLNISSPIVLLRGIATV